MPEATLPKDVKYVTQEEVDKYFKLWKETGEKLETIVDKLNKSEAEKVELVGRIKRIEDAKKPTYIPDEDDLTKVYTERNLPKTEEEWNDLFDANPNYAAELKYKAKELADSANKQVTSWQNERNTAITKLQEKHPDLYLRNEKGEIKKFKFDGRGGYAKDAAGNMVEDPNGVPCLDMESEKTKVWVELASDEQFLASAKAPLIIMEAMENRIKSKKEEDMAKKLEEDKKVKEKEREKKVDANALASGGDNPPPKEEEEVEIKYNSKEEESHVKSKVASGFYKSEKEYFQVKNREGKIPMGRGGF
jgi:hypothetical protein